MNIVPEYVCKYVCMYVCKYSRLVLLLLLQQFTKLRFIDVAFRCVLFMCNIVGINFYNNNNKRV